MTKNEKYGLAILLLISILLSLVLFYRTYVISIDGAFQYIPLAKDFVSGQFEKALKHNQQPLYSLMIAFASRWIPDFETAGKVVSSVFGILLIFPVYFLGKRIFDIKIVFIASLLLILHPAVREYSADVLKESTYLFFYATAIWFTWKTIQGEKRFSFLFVPLLSILAYFVRPDGIEVLIVVFFYVLFSNHADHSEKKWTVLFLLVLSSLILLMPYLVYLREMRGEWTFGKAKSVIDLLGLGEAKDHVSLTHKILYSIKVLHMSIWSVFNQTYLILLLFGFIKRFYTPPKKGEGFLLCCLGVHYGVLFLILLNTTRWGIDETIQINNFSGRHVLPLLFITIYWIGDGFVILYDYVLKKMESCSFWTHIGVPKRSFVLLIILMVIVSATILPKTLKARRYKRLTEKWAGAWIKNQYGGGIRIFTTMQQILYYAEGKAKYDDFLKMTAQNIKTSMVNEKAFFLVIREEEADRFFKNSDVLQKEFNEVARFEGKRMETIIVYQLIQ